jgi:hypothetical protein
MIAGAVLWSDGKVLHGSGAIFLLTPIDSAAVRSRLAAPERSLSVTNSSLRSVGVSS